MNAIVIQFNGDLNVSRDKTASNLFALIREHLADEAGRTIGITFLDDKEVAQALVSAPQRVSTNIKPDNNVHLEAVEEMCKRIIAEVGAKSQKADQIYRNDLVMFFMKNYGKYDKTLSLMMHEYKAKNPSTFVKYDYILRKYNLEFLPKFIVQVNTIIKLYDDGQKG